MDRRAACILALLAAGPAALAEPADAPVTKPATRAASTAPSTRLATTRLVAEDNPKRLLTVYALAMAAGDADKVRDSYWAETPDEKALVDAFAHMANSVGTLRKAATERYGPDGFDNIGFGRIFAAEIKRLEGTRLFVDGPKALAFTDADAEPDLRLVRVETGWKISATSFSNPARFAARIEAQAGAYDELAAEIAAGKYRLAADAQVAGRNKVAAAKQALNEKLKASSGTTKPAGPATTPDEQDAARKRAD